ncbi:hypothetical protein [Bradyrhizobium sp. ERR14]|uniref:hypothetical protein n=1 Tax=Bradyrhizobium sp. ERR14 TaxID=2663837 RepID=UPI00161F528A|nr:hypothetical protein [Bradyrhizobium sp. ERR14]MBB4396563.1 hypothetical protein [Bradyrhizobium sp. ERR14]
MDPQDLDPFNVPACSQVQHAVSQEPQTSQAGQDGFEQHLAEARQAQPAPVGAGRSYPHLSTEDRDLIDRAVAQYTAQKNPQPNTVKLYTQALRRLANDLRARGQTTDLRDHQSLVNHLDTYFPKDALMKTGVSVLRAYHDSGHLVSRGRPRALPSAKDASNDGQQSPDEAMDPSARSNLLASEEAPINHEHDATQSRAAKRQRTLNDLEEVLVYRKPSASAASGGSGGAMPVASTGVIIRGQWDRRPLYPEDAADIFRLEEALIEGGTAAVTAKQHAGSLIGYSRWLFANNKPSIVARLDGKSLSDGSDVREFSGSSNSNRLVKALEHLRTFRSTGVVVPIVRPGRTRAKLNPPNVPPINPETASLTDPIRIDGAAAQHRALQEAERQEEHQDLQENLPVPLASALLQGQVAVDPEQLPQEQLRRGLDHLDDEAIPLPVPVRSEEELQRLEKNLHDELQGRLEDHAAPSFFIDPEEFTFDPDQFSQVEFRRLLEDEDAQEVTEGRDDQPATSAFVQEQVASDSEQLPQADLRRVLDHLDDQPSDSPVSVPPEELRQLEKDLHDALHGLRDDHFAPPVSIDSEEFTFDPGRSPPEELWQLLDDGSAEQLQERHDDQFASPSLIQEQVAFDSEQLLQGELRRVLDLVDNQHVPVSVPSEELQQLEKDLHDELHGRGDNHLAAPASIDPEDFALDLEQFPPSELRRMLDDE